MSDPFGLNYIVAVVAWVLLVSNVQGPLWQATADHWLVSEHAVCACAAKKKVQGQQAQTPQQNIRYGGHQYYPLPACCQFCLIQGAAGSVVHVQTPTSIVFILTSILEAIGVVLSAMSKVRCSCVSCVLCVPLP